jgi:hypothetical protein
LAKTPSGRNVRSWVGVAVIIIVILLLGYSLYVVQTVNANLASPKPEHAFFAFDVTLPTVPSTNTTSNGLVGGFVDIESNNSAGVSVNNPVTMSVQVTLPFPITEYSNIKNLTFFAVEGLELIGSSSDPSTITTVITAAPETVTVTVSTGALLVVPTLLRYASVSLDHKVGSTGGVWGGSAVVTFSSYGTLPASLVFSGVGFSPYYLSIPPFIVVSPASATYSYVASQTSISLELGTITLDWGVILLIIYDVFFPKRDKQTQNEGKKQDAVAERLDPHKWNATQG